MSRYLVRASFAAASLAIVLAHGAASAAPRTFVASTGVDSNPCTLVLPCRSFGSAITQTGDGGEVIVLDSAGYGTVTITKSVSIIAPEGVYAGVAALSPSNFAIDIVGAGVEVLLRGLTINGQGTVGAGIQFLGSKLHVENCIISGMATVGMAFPHVGLFRLHQEHNHPRQS
jgi:hypothetical protein